MPIIRSSLKPLPRPYVDVPMPAPANSTHCAQIACGSTRPALAQPSESRITRETFCGETWATASATPWCQPPCRLVEPPSRNLADRAADHLAPIGDRHGGHERVDPIVVHDEREPVGGQQAVEHELGATLGFLQRLARHGARAVDHERQVERIALRQVGRRVGRLDADEDFERVVVAREQRGAARGGEEGGKGTVLLLVLFGHRSAPCDGVCAVVGAG